MANTSSPAGGRALAKRLSAKDIVLLAVLGVVMFVVMMAFSMAFGLNVNTAWWAHAVGAIPVGIIWVYAMAKVRKTGAGLITGAVMAIVAFLMGMLWTGPVGMVVGAAIGEAVMVAMRRSRLSIAIAFSVFIFCWWLGQISLILATGDAYVQTIVDMGMSAEYGQGMVDWVHSVAFPVAGVCTLATPLLGSWVGTRIFDKHFAKISA